MFHDLIDHEMESAGWLNSRSVYALCTKERHLGHIIREQGRWRAFDAIHPIETGNGFLYLGEFRLLREAKIAVEMSVIDRPRSKSTSAGSIQ